jgi:hypothetical protein
LAIESSSIGNTLNGKKQDKKWLYSTVYGEQKKLRTTTRGPLTPNKQMQERQQNKHHNQLLLCVADSFDI